MLLNPTVSFGPDIVKDTFVVVLVWYDLIVALDICEFKSPLIRSTTIVPLSVIACTVVVNGVGVGNEVGRGEGVSSDVGEGEGVPVGV